MADRPRDPNETPEMGPSEVKTKSGELLMTPSQAEETLAGSNVKTGNSIDFLLPPTVPGDMGSLGGFRIIKILGEGGMGLVFLAEDSSLSRKLAIKVILPTHANQTAKERFFREARATAALHHDNVISIFQVGEDNGVPFLAMPFLQGIPLDKYLAEQKKLPVKEALRITVEALAGLSSAHSRSMVHRDIKPSNIWLEGARKKVILLDFGLAKGGSVEDTSLTSVGAIMGTPAYMSPEQAQAQKVDRRSDLFSMGVVLYEMLTGEGPFKGKTVMAVLANLMSKDPKPPCEVDPSVPNEVSDICLWMLEKDIEKRPRSAREVAARIQGYEKGGDKEEHTEAEAKSEAAKTDSIVIKKTGEAPWNPKRIEEFNALYPSAQPKESQKNQRKKRKNRKSSLGLIILSMIGAFVFIMGGLIFSIQIISHSDQKEAKRIVKIDKKISQDPVKEELKSHSDQKEGKQVDKEEKKLNQDPVKEELKKGPDGREEARLQKAIIIQEILLKTDPGDSTKQNELARMHNNLGDFYSRYNLLKKEEASRLKALAIYQLLIKTNPTNLDFLFGLARSHHNLGCLYRDTKRINEAGESIQKALAIRETLVKAYPMNSKVQSDLGHSHYNLANLYKKTNRLKEAEESYQKAIAIFETLVKGNPTNSAFRISLINTKNEFENFRK